MFACHPPLTAAELQTLPTKYCCRQKSKHFFLQNTKGRKKPSLSYQPYMPSNCGPRFGKKKPHLTVQNGSLSTPVALSICPSIPQRSPKITFHRILCSVVGLSCFTCVLKTSELLQSFRYSFIVRPVPERDTKGTKYTGQLLKLFLP